MLTTICRTTGETDQMTQPKLTTQQKYPANNETKNAYCLMRQQQKGYTQQGMYYLTETIRSLHSFPHPLFMLCLMCRIGICCG